MMMIKLEIKFLKLDIWSIEIILIFVPSLPCLPTTWTTLSLHLHHLLMVSYRYAGPTSFLKSDLFVDCSVFSVTFRWDGAGWLKGNEGQTGLYRVNYDDKTWKSLTEQLSFNHTVCAKRTGYY
jgi:hypothetical protein